MQRIYSNEKFPSIQGGELFERVIEEDYVLTEKACTVFMRQICEAVEFIHSRQILHLDLKPENVNFTFHIPLPPHTQKNNFSFRFYV